MDTGSSDKKLVKVTIFQQPYTLRSSGELGETEALACAVDDLMNQIATRTSGSDPTRVAVIACLHLADRVRRLERDAASTNERLRRLLDRLPPVDG